MKAGAPLEGLLFPATYQFPPLKSARDLVELQIQTFRKMIAQVDLRRAARAHLTVYDVVTIASVIEREVSVPSERALVAAVIWNRLRVGMPLQMDSVVAYGLHLPGASLTAADFAIDTPYNVYLHRGLPPTPDLEPGPGRAASCRRPGPRLLSVFRRSRRRLRPALLRRHLPAVPQGQGESRPLTGRPVVRALPGRARADSPARD